MATWSQKCKSGMLMSPASFTLTPDSHAPDRPVTVSVFRYPTLFSFLLHLESPYIFFPLNPIHVFRVSYS